MRFLADKLTTIIFEKGVISEEDYALYHYGLQTGMEMTLCFFVSIVLACILDVLLETLVVSVVLFALRAYICGIHMKHYITCLIGSTTLITIGPYMVKTLHLPKELTIVGSALLLIMIHCFAYNTIAYHSDKDEIVYFTKQRRRILIIIGIVDFVLSVSGKTHLMKQVFYGLMVAFISIILEMIRIAIIQRRNRDEKDSEI